MNKEAMKAIGAQVVSILGAALAAIVLASMQSVLASNGVSCTPGADPGLAGGLAAFLKGVHSAATSSRLT